MTVCAVPADKLFKFFRNSRRRRRSLCSHSWLELDADVQLIIVIVTTAQIPVPSSLVNVESPSRSKVSLSTLTNDRESSTLVNFVISLRGILSLSLPSPLDCLIFLLKLYEIPEKN